MYWNEFVQILIMNPHIKVTACLSVYLTVCTNCCTDLVLIYNQGSYTYFTLYGYQYPPRDGYKLKWKIRVRLPPYLPFSIYDLP